MDDMSEGKIFLLCAFLFTIMVCAIASIVGYVSNRNSERYFAAEKQCIDAGGSWAPTRDSEAMCLRLK